MTFNRETLKPEYQLVIGEAGESCAFYIAGKMGMPEHMIKNAAMVHMERMSFLRISET